MVGPQSYHRLPDLLARAGAARVVDTEFPAEDKFDHLAAPSRAAIRKRGVSAFVTVQEGCDKFCTFCVVPYTRGAEVSRPVAKIVAEAERLADAGVREITLLGQNVNAYHGEGPDGRACDARPAAAPARRHPRHRAAALHDQPSARHGRRADRRASRPAGADAATASAGAVGLRPHPRGHEPPPYRAPTICASIERLRAARPDIAFTSDFIVGFPGETEDDFARHAAPESTRSALPAPISFKYSPRPGTPAADMDQVPEAVKDERLHGCRPTIEPHQAAFMAALRRHDLRRAVREARPPPGQIVGRSPYLQPVQVMAPSSLIGEIAPVTITESAPTACSARSRIAGAAARRSPEAVGA